MKGKGEKVKQGQEGREMTRKGEQVEVKTKKNKEEEKEKGRKRRERERDGERKRESTRERYYEKKVTRIEKEEKGDRG